MDDHRQQTDETPQAAMPEAVVTDHRQEEEQCREKQTQNAIEQRQSDCQCHLDKDNIAVRILFTASKHFVYSLFFYI